MGALGWAAVAGGASLGAGAIHAAAIGVHAEHQQAVVAFTIVAAVQLGVGALTLARPGRILMGVGAVANVAILGGWVLAKTSGIAFVDGLEEAEAVQTADGLAAGLAAVAVLAVAAHLAGWARTAVRASSLLTGGTAVLVAALAVPGMLAAGGHAHESGHGDTHGTAASDDDQHTQDEHADGGEHATAAVAAKPYDPSLPIDLGGVDGVTPQQQAAAENLVAVTLLRLPRFADAEAVEAMGFISIGDGGTGHEHYLSPANMTDDKLLDPDHPESLVFDTSVTPKRLAAAMFMLDAGATLDDVPELGGKLTQWHIHDNLCFAGTRVAGLTRADGSCPRGLDKGPQVPMIHVWIEPNRCGPFAALEGIAGGRVPDGEARLCDHAHG
ncbi:MAG: hypothetical protein ABWZ76_13985 [Acidimicrobiales bacterium]